MPFAIIALDRAGAGALRARLRQEHLDYLNNRKDIMLAGGAMLDEAGNPTGGLIIIDTDDRQIAERFSAGDPFTTGGIFGDVRIISWRKSFFDFERCV